MDVNLILTSAGIVFTLDQSVHAVYDPGIRKLITGLGSNELQRTAEEFEPVLGKNLKKVKNKTPGKKDPVRIFWNIKDTADKLGDLKRRMKKIPVKPSGNAPRIILKRRLPALEWRLKEIDEALKTVPVPARKGRK
jgi:hypothetical protein